MFTNTNRPYAGVNLHKPNGNTASLIKYSAGKGFLSIGVLGAAIMAMVASIGDKFSAVMAEMFHVYICRKP